MQDSRRCCLAYLLWLLEHIVKEQKATAEIAPWLDPQNFDKHAVNLPLNFRYKCTLCIESLRNRSMGPAEADDAIGDVCESLYHTSAL
jgi:hypothetical protein